MSSRSKIEWTDRTWNPLLGCVRVSPGCDACYAIRQARIRAGSPNEKVAAAFADLTEYRNGRLDWTGTVRFLPDRLHQPLILGAPSKWFVNSLADLFYGTSDDQVAHVFAVMASAQRHVFQVATKRPARARALLSSGAFRRLVAEHVAALAGVGRPDTRVDPRETWPLPNVWVGVSVEDQHWAGIRLPVLRQIPAAIRWVSAEPLLGAVDLSPYLQDIDWVVAGGESGPSARPMHPAWPRALRDQCAAAGIAYLFKQWGEWAPADQVTVANRDTSGVDGSRHRGGGTRVGLIDPTGALRSTNDLSSFRVPDGWVEMARVGKRTAGRQLDGAELDAYPA